ncbi:MAG: hypothetical protein IE914_04310 [Thiotrichales bacterium]|nr:hypothetical protein [Thiotrichales bacterium]
MTISVENYKDALDELMMTVKAMIDVLPQKGDTENDCQKINLINRFSDLQAVINGIEAEDLEGSSAIFENLFFVARNQSKVSRERALLALLGDIEKVVVEHGSLRLLAWSNHLTSSEMEDYILNELEYNEMVPSFKLFSEGKCLVDDKTFNWIAL